jgi:Mg2+-importing ATPase
VSINKRLIEEIKHEKIYRNKSVEEVFKELETSADGLTTEEAEKRQKLYGFNTLKARQKTDSLTLLISQFKNPIVIILLFASVLSFVLGEPVDGIIIISLIFLSNFLGFKQEKRASDTVAQLLSIIQSKISVFRDGTIKEILEHEIVIGDIVILSAGKTIPGDCLILEAKDLFINEATLTGETFPVEKTPGIVSKDTPMNKRINILYMGTNVVSGNGKAIVVKTAKDTEFGKISERLRLRPAETEFERGIKKFGNFLIRITLILVIAIFFFSALLQHGIFESLLFSLSLAVGITPELLPTIISITLSQGAKKMAQDKVIVKRLNSIQNLGSMNVLCSDKTGTLTEGKPKIKDFIDFEGNSNHKAFLYAYINAYYQKGYENPIDAAILQHKTLDITEYQKLDEIPYDFIRKRLSILVSNKNESILISKGAFNNILSICSKVETSNEEIKPIAEITDSLTNKFVELSSQGLRVLGIAYKDLGNISVIHNEDEKDLTFLGFLILFDPLKAEIKETILKMNNLGILLKVVTGDSSLVAKNLGIQLGMVNTRVITGTEMHRLSDEALLHLVNNIDIFAEVEPNQKERIILSLKKFGNVVGYIGDGINDATALHAADVGISVDSAVDVAKEAADIVLLERNLKVLINGIISGRKTFANTLKYIFITTGANFGNMFSMAGASLFIPFLPLLPPQILLTNFITDFPAVNISTDNVDDNWVNSPKRWDINFILKFMLVFGLTSSFFDYLVFFVLLYGIGATPEEFHTAWFLESVLTELFIILVIRTQSRFYKSKPSKALLYSIIFVSLIVFAFPYTPLNLLFNFVPLPFPLVLLILAITIGYVFTSEGVKVLFYKKVKLQ